MMRGRKKGVPPGVRNEINGDPPLISRELRAIDSGRIAVRVILQAISDVVWQNVHAGEAQAWLEETGFQWAECLGMKVDRAKLQEYIDQARGSPDKTSRRWVMDRYQVEEELPRRTQTATLKRILDSESAQRKKSGRKQVGFTNYPTYGI